MGIFQRAQWMDSASCKAQIDGLRRFFGADHREEIPQPPKGPAKPFRRTAVVGEHILSDGARALAEAGEPVTGFASLNTLDRVLCSTRATVDSVLIDVEGCGGIAGVIDRLLQFRLKHPTVPVILASREVQLDDLSAGRLPIADATVRLPLSRARAVEAKSAALENNLIWQKRLGNRFNGPFAVQ